MLPSIQLVVSWCAVYLAGVQGQIWAGPPPVRSHGVLHRTGKNTWTELMPNGKVKIHVTHPIVHPSLMAPAIPTVIKPWGPKEEVNFWRSLALKQLYKSPKVAAGQIGLQEPPFKKPSQPSKFKGKKYRPEKFEYYKEEHQKEHPREPSKYNDEYSSSKNNQDEDHERDLNNEYTPREPSNDYVPNSPTEEYRPHPPRDEYRSHPPSDEYRTTVHHSPHQHDNVHRPHEPSDGYRSSEPNDEYRSQDSRDEFTPSQNNKENGENDYFSSPTDSPEFEEDDSHHRYRDSHDEYDHDRPHKSVSKWKPTKPYYQDDKSWRDETPLTDDQFSSWKDEDDYWRLKEEPSKKVENAKNPVHPAKTIESESGPKYSAPPNQQSAKLKGPRSVHQEHQEQPIVEAYMWTGQHSQPLWKPDHEQKLQEIPRFTQPIHLVNSHGVHTKEQDEKPVEYEFQYSVNSPKTGDVKSHKEMRKGDKVVGRYTTAESDGTTRVVEYTSDKHSGFKAVVKNHGKKSEEHKKEKEGAGHKQAWWDKNSHWSPKEQDKWDKNSHWSPKEQNQWDKNSHWSPKEQDQGSWRPAEVYSVQQQTTPQPVIQQQHQPQYRPQQEPQYHPQHQPQYQPKQQPQYHPQHQPQYHPQQEPQHQPYQPQVYHVIHQQSPQEQSHDHEQVDHYESEARHEAKSHQSVTHLSIPGQAHNFRVMHSY